MITLYISLLWYRLCDVLQKSWKEWFLQKCGALNADDSGGQHISAIIREKITAKEERFKVILMSYGTKYNYICSSKDFNSTCDGHAVALSYETVAHYFLKLTQKINCNVLLPSKDGFQLNPEYKFHLFVSHPPCGFMANESEPLISWKMPFVGEPHIPTCSSKIVLNSYLGIQGPLICLFAKPIYISEVIVLNVDDSIIEKAYQKFKEATEKLAQQSMFSFHPPEIKVLKDPTLFGNEPISPKAQEGSFECVAVLRNPDDDGNPVFSVRILKKNSEKVQGNGKIQGNDLENMHNDEKFLALSWCKNSKLCFNKFYEIHKAIISHLKVFEEIVNLSKKLKEDCQHTASNLKKKTDQSLAEITKLVDEMNYEQYQGVNSGVTDLLHDIDCLRYKKENELRMIEDMQVLVKQLSKNKTGVIPMCCCWKRYLSLLQQIELRSTLKLNV